MASTVACFSTREDNLSMRSPRVVGDSVRHSPLKAARAAETAMSTSAVDAACTSAIGVSSLWRKSVIDSRLLAGFLPRVDARNLSSSIGFHKVIVDEQSSRLFVLGAIGGRKFSV